MRLVGLPRTIHFNSSTPPCRSHVHVFPEAAYTCPGPNTHLDLCLISMVELQHSGIRVVLSRVVSLIQYQQAQLGEGAWVMSQHI